jgi:tripartite-type tricarboxylate transporter receptor subunit TctC
MIWEDIVKFPHRRQFLHLATGAAALPVVSRIARAQAYPTRPVRIIVGYPAGGTVDFYARLIGQWMSERLGQPFVVENRPGATSNIATEMVVRAPADGHTLLMVSSANALNATLYDKLNFVFIRDIVAVVGVSRESNAIVVNPSVPAKSVPEFITYAKANPGKTRIASPGMGTPAHVAGELFKMMTGVDMLHVPYRGTVPALTDLLSGQMDVYFGAASGSIEHVKVGKLRALATTGAARSEVLPGLPTVAEFIPGFEASTWFGLGAPKGTSVEIIDRLSKEVVAALGDPKTRARFAELGSETLVGSPADFGKLISDETEKWGSVIRAANIKPE